MSRRQTTLDTKQEELALSAVKAHAIFPGRTVLRVAEVAAHLTITEQQVVDLITGGQLLAVDISSGLKSTDNPKGNRTARAYWRIPVSSFDEFIARRKNL